MLVMNNQWQPYTDLAERQGRSSYSTPQQQQQYQTPAMSSHSNSMAASPSSTPRTRSYAGDGDTAMEDADPYNPLKYPQRPTHSQRPSVQYIPQGDYSRKYSPMQTNTPSSHYPASPQHPPGGSHAQYTSQNSSARQSPTRNQYTTPSHSFYSTPCKSTEKSPA